MNALSKLKSSIVALSCGALLLFFISVSELSAVAQSHPWWPGRPDRVISTDRVGSLATQQSLELTLTADRGNIRVYNDGGGEVRYRVTLESYSTSPQAIEQLQKFSLDARSTPRGVLLEGRLPAGASSQSVWATYEIHVPAHYSLHISTRAGEILTSDVNGRVYLLTGGGNIETGKIGDFLVAKNEPAVAVPPGELVARIETGGGRITVGDVAGALFANSGGGHVIAGDIYGDATVQTRGGEIRMGRIAGSARISSGGGNISVESAGNIVAQTSAGRVDLAEVSGPLQTRRVGGGEELRMEILPAAEESALARKQQTPFSSPFASNSLAEAAADEDLPRAEIPLGPWDAPVHGSLWELSRKIENFWWGAVRVDAAEQQKRLLQAPAPEYPEPARRAGIEGQVTMLVRIAADGTVQDATLLYGEPVLGRAAAHAIEQWYYAPLRIGGEPVNVLTSVTLAFELQ